MEVIAAILAITGTVLFVAVVAALIYWLYKLSTDFS